MISLTPDECIFAIARNDDYPEWAVYVTTIDHFQKNGFQIDQHLNIQGFNWPAVEEAVFDPPTQDALEIHRAMLKFGFHFDTKFADFLAGLGDSLYEVYRPPLTCPRGVSTPRLP